MITTIATRALAVLALAGGVGTAAYLTGAAGVDTATHWSRGFEAGLHAGVRRGLAQDAGEARQAAHRFRPGQPGYAAIFAAGRRQGYRFGRYDGLAAGAQQAADGLPGGQGDWQPGQWYLVRLGAAARGGLQVSQRTAIAPDQLYGACRQDPTAMCDEPIPRG